ARTAHNADTALGMDMARHDADLDFVGRDETWAVGPQQQSLSVLGAHTIANHHHVANWNAFSDANDQIQVRLDGFPDCVGGTRWRHVNDRNRSARCVFGVLHAGVDWDAFEIFTRFLRMYAGNKGFAAVCVVTTHARVELPRLTSDALGDDLGVFINENRH